MARERCADCKFYRLLKHNFALFEGYDESHCCVVFEYADEDKIDKRKDSFVIECCEDDFCEMFTPWN